MSGRQPGLPRPSLAASAAPPPHAPCPLNFHCPAYLPYRHSICLVCKSWNSLFFQAPGLWRSLLLDGRLAAARGKLAAWLAAKRSLLARLGSVVTVAHAELVDPEEDFFIERYPLDTRMSEDEGEDEGAQPSDSQPSGDAWDSVAPLLQALPPSLCELRLLLQCGEARAAGLAMPSLPALDSLSIQAPWVPGNTAVQPVVAAWLPLLPCLRAFTWSSPYGADLSAQLMDAVGGLSGLTALSLQVRFQQ